MERNLYMVNGFPPTPTRLWRKNTGPFGSQLDDGDDDQPQGRQQSQYADGYAHINKTFDGLLPNGISSGFNSISGTP